MAGFGSVLRATMNGVMRLGGGLVIFVVVMVLVVNLFVPRFLVMMFSSVLILSPFLVFGCVLRVTMRIVGGIVLFAITMIFVIYRSVPRFLMVVFTDVLITLGPFVVI